MLKTILIVIALALLPVSVDGRVSRICKVSYETRAGWSDDRLVEVTFMTGRELNRFTRTYDYGPYSNYGLIWFGEREVAILKLDRFLMGVGVECEHDDFLRLFRIMGQVEAEQDNSKYPRRWRLTGKEFLRYVDPRANQ